MNSVEKINVCGLKVYPNPNQNHMMIENPTSSNAKITIYSN